jgi:hypothetical protein
MSRGSFEYKEYHMGELADMIEDCVGNGRFENDLLLNHAKKTVEELRYLKDRIEVLDSYISGDIGEATAVERLFNLHLFKEYKK